MKKALTAMLALLLMLTYANAACAITLQDLVEKYEADLNVYERGDSGEDVLKIQLMLYQLGYLDGAADGDFGPQTEKSVKRFQQDMCLNDDGRVTQSVYTALENKYEECFDPTTGVVLGFCNWKETSRNRLDFRVQVTNMNNMDYQGIAMAFYCEDEYGCRVYPADVDTVQVLTTQMDMEMGVRRYTDYIRLEERDDIANVYVAVWGVQEGCEMMYVDSEDLQYLCYPIK